MIFVRNSSARETPVNIALMRAGLISVNHRHKWWFKQSGGPPPAVGSDGVAAIITASHRFGAFPLRDRMVEAVLDPKMANAVRALGLTVPADGFADAAEFRAWLARESENFEELIGSDAGAAASL